MEKIYSRTKRKFWNKTKFIILLSILLFLAGVYIGYTGFINYSNNLFMLGELSGRDKTIRTIMQESSIPYFEFNEAENLTIIKWVPIKDLCLGIIG